MIPEMLDQSQNINEKIVGHYWTTPEFNTLMNLKGSLPSDEQNIEGLFDAVSSKRFFKGKIGQYGPKSLLDFLTGYLAELVGERVGDAYSLPVYRSFAERHLGEDDVAIITFNYDFLGEQLLDMIHEGFHYGFTYDPDKYRYFRLRGARQGPLLLKLHGSLSWLICTICRTVWMHDGRADHWQGKDCLRSQCQGRLRLLIVPPLSEKSLAARETAVLWEQAREVLREAVEIVVIGFSFMPADRLAMDLFRDALQKNKGVSIAVHNGRGYEYDLLKGRMGVKKFSATGLRMEEL